MTIDFEVIGNHPHYQSGEIDADGISELIQKLPYEVKTFSQPSMNHHTGENILEVANSATLKWCDDSEDWVVTFE